MVALESHGARKAAYGRLATAAANSGDPQLQAYHSKLQTSGVEGRREKQLELLKDWVIDPSFGNSQGILIIVIIVTILIILIIVTTLTRPS